MGQSFVTVVTYGVVIPIETFVEMFGPVEDLEEDPVWTARYERGFRWYYNRENPSNEVVVGIETPYTTDSRGDIGAIPVDLTVFSANQNDVRIDTLWQKLQSIAMEKLGYVPFEKPHLLMYGFYTD